MPHRDGATSALILGLLMAVGCAPRRAPERVLGRVPDRGPTVALTQVRGATWTMLPYRVDGVDVAAIAAALNARGPRSNDGRPFRAMTSIRYTLRADSGRGIGECRMRNPRLAVVAQTTFPQHAAATSLAPPLRAQWETYTAALMAHERGHVMIATQIADSLLGVVSTLADVPCATWAQHRSVLLARAGEAALPRQTSYDRATNHGRREGATWPPR